MSNKESKEVKKSIERPLYGSREAPAYESLSAPSSGMKTGKPRPPSSD